LPGFKVRISLGLPTLTRLISFMGRHRCQGTSRFNCESTGLFPQAVYTLLSIVNILE
jgi:hypothetical protein